MSVRDGLLFAVGAMTAVGGLLVVVRGLWRRRGVAASIPRFAIGLLLFAYGLTMLLLMMLDMRSV